MTLSTGTGLSPISFQTYVDNISLLQINTKPKIAQCRWEIKKNEALKWITIIALTVIGFAALFWATFYAPAMLTLVGPGILLLLTLLDPLILTPLRSAAEKQRNKIAKLELFQAYVEYFSKPEVDLEAYHKSLGLSPLSPALKTILEKIAAHQKTSQTASKVSVYHVLIPLYARYSVSAHLAEETLKAIIQMLIYQEPKPLCEEDNLRALLTRRFDPSLIRSKSNPDYVKYQNLIALHTSQLRKLEGRYFHNIIKKGFFAARMTDPLYSGTSFKMFGSDTSQISGSDSEMSEACFRLPFFTSRFHSLGLTRKTLQTFYTKLLNQRLDTMELLNAPQTEIHALLKEELEKTGCNTRDVLLQTITPWTLTELLLQSKSARTYVHSKINTELSNLEAPLNKYDPFTFRNTLIRNFIFELWFTDQIQFQDADKQIPQIFAFDPKKEYLLGLLTEEERHSCHALIKKHALSKITNPPQFMRLLVDDPAISQKMNELAAKIIAKP